MSLSTNDLTSRRTSGKEKPVASFTIRLLDADTKKNPPLRAFHVTVERLDKDGKRGALLFAGRSNRAGEISFQLDLPTETAGQPLPPLAKVKLTVFDIDGEALITETIQPKPAESIPSIKVKTAQFRKKLTAPLDEWRNVLGYTSSTAVQKLLKEREIGSLAAVAGAKDLAKAPGLSANDKQHLELMKAHASLLLLSQNLQTNQVLIDAEFRHVLDVARSSLGTFMAKVSPTISQEQAKRLYSISQRQEAILSTIYTDRKAKETNGMQPSEKGTRQARSSRASKKKTKEGNDTAPANGSNPEPPCQCNCGSAVSPQAYLVDLIDYAVDNVLRNNTAIDLAHLEELFCQPFAALPVECSFADKLLRQVRLCVEVLHQRSVLKDESKMRTAVRRAIEAHVVRAYDALLRALGTSYRELRQVRSDTEASAQLADRLGITTDHTDNFRLELQGIVSKRLNENNLERLFGLPGAARDPLSTGAKFADNKDQITRWQLRGIEWRTNTDELGCIYVTVRKKDQEHEISLFKSPGREAASRVAAGSTPIATGEVELVAKNSSGLAGRVNLNYSEDDSSIFLAVVPEWAIRRRKRLRLSWQEADNPAGSFAELMIDPDVIGNADIMQGLLKWQVIGPVGENPAKRLWAERGGWLKTRRKELADLSAINEMLRNVWSTKPSNLASWDAIANKLRSSDPSVTAEGHAAVTNLDKNLTPATFSFLLELRHRQAASQEIKPEERNQAVDVLVNLVKRKQFEDWKTAEANIRLASPFFLLSNEEPVLNPLRASTEERAAWRAELEHNSALPLIDPDIISQSNFAPHADSTPAFTLWTTRNQVLEDLFASVERITSKSKLNGALTAGDDLDLVNPLFHPIGITQADLPRIANALAQGDVLPITPEQYGLTMSELRRLFEVRQPGYNADTTDWDDVHHILLQAEKRRYLYPLWRTEEQDMEISLNPDVFYLPSDELIELLPLTERTPAFLQWRFDPQRYRAWRQILKSRIEQDQAIDTEWQNAIDDAEEASLPALRDDLVMATVSANEAGGESKEERKRWVMNHLLINAFDNGCRKTTRVAQAIETMQLFLWGIHSRQFEDPKYSLEEATAETFAEEWRSLGSYADWRSAMFTFLYPENVLLPDLRREIGDANTDPTLLFQAILKVISGQASPSTTNDGAETEQSDNPLIQAWIDRIFGALEDLDPTQDSGQRRIAEELPDWRTITVFGSNIRTYDSAKVNYLFHPTDAFALWWTHVSQKPPDLASNMMIVEWRNVFVVAVYEAFQLRTGDLSGPTPQTVSSWARYLIESALLEDLLYIPLSFALSQLRAGRFEEALSWFSKVYDFKSVPTEGNQGWAHPHLERYFKERQATDASAYESLDVWLDDKLNPHRIAATRPWADARFLILAIIQCLLNYADSEFAKDTTESLARARELYETARRLLDSEQLGKKLGDCQDVIGTLVSEVGEDQWGPVLDTALDDIPSPAEEDYLTREQRDQLINGIRGILAPTNPPSPLPEIRERLIDLVSDHFSPRPPRGLELRRLTGNQTTFEAYEGLLKEPDIFKAVQRVSGNGANWWSFANPVSVMAIDTPPDRGGWIRAPRFEFCIPRNPLIGFLRLRFETNWFKLHNCMNLAGQYREVPAYAAPTDTYSRLPFADLGPPDAVTPAAPFGPTFYRYRALIERAKQLVGLAQQMEANYLSFLEKRDAEDYNLRKAQQDLGIANANVNLQKLNKQQAVARKGMADSQYEKVNFIREHYQELIDDALLPSEEIAWNALRMAAVIQALAAPLAALEGDTSPMAQSLSLTSSANSMYANYERRKQEWEFQRDIAQRFDLVIADQQIKLAEKDVEIAQAQKQIAELGAENASDIVHFLNSKFTNVELYAWMGGIVGNIYRYFLQEATSIAKLAQRQLAFERQETELTVVLDDYWTYTNTSAVLRGDNGSTDRRGMTGSARLLQDITRLDQEAFLTDRRKLQLTKTFSLALFDPIAFARFRESGVLIFSTTPAQFDRDFPGHYLRLIKRVRVSVIALVPPTDGIHATLTSSGISKVVRGGNTFDEVVVRRDPESIAFTSPINATGLFELQEQPDMLLPFEGTGVAATGWTLTMPRAANAIDYNSIADVLLTIEYTALDGGATYRGDVIRALDRAASGERPFSFRHTFADCWYDLNNPNLLAPERQMRVSFQTRRSDFPPNVSDLFLKDVSLYFVRRDGFTKNIDVELLFTELGYAGREGGQATTTNGLIRASEANGGSWSRILSDSTRQKQPIGAWELNLLKPNVGSADREEIKGWFKNGDIEDILFVITYGGTTPEWPK